jgi:large subunit ribosomal protein L18
MRIKYKNPRQKRKVRIRKNIYGTIEVPRVAVFKSNKNIYAQAINDIEGKTIAEASSLNKKFNGESTNADIAKEVGLLLGEELDTNGVKRIVFDRGGYIYHGQVKALADGIREKGIKF